jgi:hypothetical protein
MRSTQRRNFSLGEEALHPDLCLRRKQVHLIQKHRPAFSLLKYPDAPVKGARERVFFMPEQYGVQQVGCNRPAIDL